jgi:hypothetical protein
VDFHYLLENPQDYQEQGIVDHFHCVQILDCLQEIFCTLQDAEMESDNEIDRGGGGMLGNNDDEYVSDGGEVEREEVEHDDTGPQSPASGPASPNENRPGSPDVNSTSL